MDEKAGLRPQLRKRGIPQVARLSWTKYTSRMDRSAVTIFAALFNPCNFEAASTRVYSSVYGVRMRIQFVAAVVLRRVVMLSHSLKFDRHPDARWANCAFGTIRASIALLVLVSLVHP